MEIILRYISTTSLLSRNNGFSPYTRSMPGSYIGLGDSVWKHLPLYPMEARADRESLDGETLKTRSCLLKFLVLMPKFANILATCTLHVTSFVYVFVFMCACGSLRLTSSIFLNCSFNFWRQGLPMRVATRLDWQASWLQGSPCFCFSIIRTLSAT